MNELEMATWSDVELVDASEVLTTTRAASTRRCFVCGSALATTRLTCSARCKSKRDGLLRRIALRRVWQMQWQALRGRSGHPTAEIDREVGQLEVDIAELLDGMRMRTCDVGVTRR